MKLRIVLLTILLAAGIQAQEIINGGSAAGSSSSAEADITTGLVHHWAFEAAGSGDVTTVTDAGSGGNNLTCTNTPQWSSTTCAVGSNCIDFAKASSEYCATATSPTLPTGDAFSYSFWFRVDAADSNVFTINNAAAGSELQFYIDASPNLVTGIDGIGNTMTAQGLVTTGYWNHTVMVREKTILLTYINGELFSTRTATGAALDFSTCQVLIAVDPDATCVTSLGNYYDGQMDDFRIYSRALSQVDVQALYALGN